MRGLRVLILCFVLALALGFLSNWSEGLFTGRAINDEVSLVIEVNALDEFAVAEDTEEEGPPSLGSMGEITQAVGPIDEPISAGTIRSTSLLDAVSDPRLEALFLSMLNKPKKKQTSRGFLDTFSEVSNPKGEAEVLGVIINNKIDENPSSRQSTGAVKGSVREDETVVEGKKGFLTRIVSWFSGLFE